MGQPKTDTELVVELIESAETMLEKVQEVHLRLTTLASRVALRGDVLDEITDIAEIIEEYAE